MGDRIEEVLREHGLAASVHEPLRTETIRAWAAALVEAGIGDKAQGEALVTHADPDEHARIWNLGYEAAMAQQMAPDPTTADDWLAEVRAQARREALSEAAEVVEEECPHEPDEHPEGCCEVCDTTFATAAELRQRAEEVGSDA